MDLEVRQVYFSPTSYGNSWPCVCPMLHQVQDDQELDNCSDKTPEFTNNAHPIWLVVKRVEPLTA